MTPMRRPTNIGVSVRIFPGEATRVGLRASTPARAKVGMIAPYRPINIARDPITL
jgi:hypothetical protein